MESDLISYIVEQLAGIILTCLVSGMSSVSKMFSATMRPNVDASGNDTTLDLFFKIFLPNSETLWLSIIACGLFILYGILIFQLFKGLFGPIAKAESPVRLVGKTLLFAILVVSSKEICSLFFYLSTVPYDMLQTTALQQLDIGSALSGALEGMLTNIVTPPGAVETIFRVIFSICLLFSIFINYMKLIIEIVERYVILGILSLFSPLCIATGASENTNNIFKSWIKMMISQCILMCMSVFFLSVFEASVKNISTLKADGLIVLLLYLAWLRTGQRIDAHMSTLGLTTAQAGNGLYADMISGAAAARGAIRSATGAVTKGATIGTGMAMAGGARNWAASSEGQKFVGAGISRIARAGQSSDGKIKTAEFDAATSPMGFARGAQAKAGAEAKYGNTQIDNEKGGAGTTLNDRLAAGDQIKSASMDGSGAVLNMQDKDGNEYRLTFGDAADGSSIGQFEGSTDAMRNVFGLEEEGQMSSSGFGGQEGQDAEQATPDDQGLSAQGEDVAAFATAEGGLQEGTNITDANGETAGIVDADNSDAMQVTGPMAMGADGQMHDVSAAMNEDGSLRTNAAGELIDADGNVLKDSEGNALMANQSTLQAMGADGQMHDVSAAISEDGSIAQNEAGNLVNAQTGEELKDSNGNAISADGVSSPTTMMGADGKTHDVSAAIGENGMLTTNANGELVNAQTGELLTDSKGQAISTSNVQGGVGANMKTIGTMSDGSQVDLTGKVDANGKAMGGMKEGDTFTAGGQTFSVGADGKVSQVGADGSKSAISMSQAASMGQFAKGEDGSMQSIAGSLNSTGTGFKAGAVQSDGKGGAFVMADDGKTKVPVSGAVNQNGQMVGGTPTSGTFSSMSQQSGLSVSTGKGSISIGAASMVSAGSAGVAAGAPTYNAGGGLALGSDGKMHDVSNQVSSNGILKNGAEVQTDSAGNSFITASDGARIGVSGNKVSGGTYSEAAGGSGAYAVQTGGTAKITGGVSGLSADATTYNAGGGLAFSNGGMHDVSSQVNSDGTLKSNASVYTDSSGGSYITASDGAHIPVSDGSVVGGTYSQAAGTSGAYTMGHTESGSAVMMSAGGTTESVPSTPTYGAVANIQGGSDSLTSGYVESGNGGYVKYGSDYAPVHQDGYDDSGNVQMYSQAAEGQAADFTDSNGRGYVKDDNGSFAMTESPSGGASMVNCGNDAGKTYEATSFYAGMPVTSDGQGGYNVNLGENPSIYSHGDGIIDVQSDNGVSFSMLNASVYDPPFDGCGTTTFNGQQYYVQPTSSAADYSIAQYGQSGTVGYGKVAAEKIIGSASGEERNFFRAQEKIEGASGDGAYVPASDNSSSSGYAQYVQDSSGNYSLATREQMADASIPKYNRHAVGANGGHDGFMKASISEDGSQKVQNYRTITGSGVQNVFTYDNGVFTLQGMPGSGKEGSCATRTYFPADKFDAPVGTQRVSFGGKEYFAVSGSMKQGTKQPQMPSNGMRKLQNNQGPVFRKNIKVKDNYTNRNQSRATNARKNNYKTHTAETEELFK